MTEFKNSIPSSAALKAYDMFMTWQMIKFEKFIACVKTKDGIDEEHLKVAQRNFYEFSATSLKVFNELGGNLGFKDLEEAMPNNFWLNFIKGKK